MSAAAGKLDEFAIYSRVLTPAEVFAHYNASVINYQDYYGFAGAHSPCASKCVRL